MSDWKKIVGTVAPALGTALGGPLAGSAIKTLADQFLDKKDASEQDIADAVLTASPTELIKLREIDAGYRQGMAKLGVDLEKLSVQDRKNARKFAIDTGLIPQIVFSVLYTVGYLWVVWSFVEGHVEIPQNSVGQFSTVLGVLTAAQMQILNFFFGSSTGSKEKTDKLLR